MARINRIRPHGAEGSRRSGNGGARASAFNIVAGFWLIVAPFLLGYSELGLAVRNDVLVGVVVLVLAWARASSPREIPGLSWFNALLGLWLIAAPFVLGYDSVAAARWNDVSVGLIVAVLATWSAASRLRSRLSDRIALVSRTSKRTGV